MTTDLRTDAAVLRELRDLIHDGLTTTGWPAPPTETLVRALVRASGPPGDHLGMRALGDALTAALPSVWRRGWQPVELVRQAGRKLEPQARLLVLDAVVAEDAARPPGPVHGRWKAQVEELRPEALCGPSWFEDRTGAFGWSVERAVRTGCNLLVHLHRLPRRQVLLPPPGDPLPPTAGTTFEPDDTDPATERELARIRALLAKAESTGFAEEAEAFTAKAQELMTRHGISRLMVETGIGLPAARRIAVDEPYAWPKAVLLQFVAEANRCRAVHNSAFSDSTVLGYPDQLDAVAVLYTSLLTQATGSMLAAGRTRPECRSRKFRTSFLLAFAHRIGNRLAEAAATATTDAVAGQESSLLPVLAARDGAVQSAAEAVFGNVRSRSSTASDPAGWRAGTSAADRVDLGAGLVRGPGGVLGR